MTFAVSYQKRSLAMFAAWMLLAVVLVPALGGDAGAQLGTGPGGCTDSGTIICVKPAGLLRLHLGSSDYFAYEADSDADGTIDTEEGFGTPVKQSLNTQGCAASLSGPNLVTLSAGPSGATLGQKKDSIGVRNGDGGGTPCAQVNSPAETLTLSLGSAAQVQGKLIQWAEIDIESKFDAKVEARFFANGVQVGLLTIDCGQLSDCGPDSGDGDNYRFDTRDGSLGTSPAPFDTVVLRNSASGPANGAFSLEGGADGTVAGTYGSGLTINPTDSIFQLVTVKTYEGTLDCDGDDNDSTLVPGIVTTSSSIERLGNKNTECELLPYNLDGAFSTEQEVDFDIDPAAFGQADAEFFWVTTWDPEPAQYPATRTTQIDFLDGNGSQDLVWCAGTYNPGGATTDAKLANVVRNPVGGCLVYQTITIVPGGNIQVVEGVLLGKDPRMSR